MRFYLVAAFSDLPFRGNPAGVCLLDPETTVDLSFMQDVASELRQPETAFIGRGLDGWTIRWFSPQTEVDLCGHATLAAAAVLWREGLVPPNEPIHFDAAIATLSATLDPGGLIWLDFPVIAGSVEPAPECLLSPGDPSPVSSARHGERWLLEFANASEVRAVRPRFDWIVEQGIRALIVTAPSDLPSYDIVSRNFAPIVGVEEDQVTGTAHTCLAPHWQGRLGTELRCWQASQRGGAIRTRLEGSRVLLGGQAVIEFAGRCLSV
ncbi:PhzF family phenazine biosynthesis protein [Mesorhizobium sp. 10J20-29]